MSARRFSWLWLELFLVRLSYWRFSERNFTSAFCTSSASSLVPLQRFNASTVHVHRRLNVKSSGATPFPHFLPLGYGYSSLLGQCLRLVSYATGALPHLRLRAFHRRSSLPSLWYRIAGNF